MKGRLSIRARFGGLLTAALILCGVAALPFAAQQPKPFDEQRLVADLTDALLLSPGQVNTLKNLLRSRQPRIQALEQQISRQRTGSQQYNQARMMIEREQRGAMEEFLPILNPQQQTRMRALLGNPDADQPAPVSAK